MLFGDEFEVNDRKNGWVRGTAVKDGYDGWIDEASLTSLHGLDDGDVIPYRVAVRTTWAYETPDLKSPPLVDLHMTSRILVTGQHDDWLEILLADRRAFLPASHGNPGKLLFANPWAAARAFLGTPYVWAGNTGFGLDCSGLIQVAMHACGIHCRADSHQQEAETVGRRLSEDEPLVAGDLLFWKGHVAMATGPKTIIHANAHHMMVVEEPLEPAIARIAASDTGPVTSRLRPSLDAIQQPE